MRHTKNAIERLSAIEMLVQQIAEVCHGLVSGKKVSSFYSLPSNCSNDTPHDSVNLVQTVLLTKFPKKC